jgi:acetyl esterase/lipase
MLKFTLRLIGVSLLLVPSLPLSAIAQPALAAKENTAADEKPSTAPKPPAQAREFKVPDHLLLERDVEYGRAGDRPLKLDMLRPKAASQRPRPVLAFIHGGGWRGGDKAGAIRGQLFPFAMSGDYVCVSIGYRLSGEAIWPAQIHDCKAAIRFLRANASRYGLDPEKIGVWGVSAGGQLVSLLGTSGDVPQLEGDNGTPGVSSRVACVVDFCGPSDFLAFAEERPVMQRSGSPLDLLFGGPLAEKREVAIAASPVTYASAGDPPFLIVHGTEDMTVPLDQAERMAAALTKAGVHVTLVKVEGAGHALGGPQVLARVRSFLDKYLRGQDVTVSDAPIDVEKGGERKVKSEK